MPRTAANPRKVRVNEEPSGELELDDSLPARKPGEKFPASRVREAGQSGGELPGRTHHQRDITADDLSPDTLLDDGGTLNPSQQLRPRDASLSRVGAADIGAGGGLDEQELADIEPVGEREAERIKRKIEAHARDPNAVEPHEAAERAARKGG